MKESELIQTWIDRYSQLFNRGVKQCRDSRGVLYLQFDNKLCTMLSDARKQATLARLMEKENLIGIQSDSSQAQAEDLKAP